MSMSVGIYMYGYVFVCVHASTYIVLIYDCMLLSVCLYTSVSILKNMCVTVFMYVSVCRCKHKCICVYACVCLCLSFVCKCICACVSA